MASKVLDSTGAATFAEVLLGINWCVANDADVLNLSLGGGFFSSECDPVNPNDPSNNLIEQVAVAISDAYDQGIITVAASGNGGGDLTQVIAPACSSRAIAVGAVNDIDELYRFSCFNPPINMCDYRCCCILYCYCKCSTSYVACSITCCTCNCGSTYCKCRARSR